MAFEHPTRGFGGAPDVVILGAAKAGTTSLYAHLAVHPEVFMSPVKEPRFFAWGPGEGPDPADPILADSVCDATAYAALFDGAAPGQITGEASPIYMAPEHAEGAAARLHAARPDVKLIAVLRDPAERAFSHFLMSQRQGYEPLSDFVMALDAPEVMLGDWRRIRPYLSYSRYAAGLAPFVARFGRAALLVIDTADLARAPQATVARVAAHLGIAAFPEGAGTTRANVGHAVAHPGLQRLARRGILGRVARRLPAPLRRLAKAGLSRTQRSDRTLSASERAAVWARLGEDPQALSDLLGDDGLSW